MNLLWKIRHKLIKLILYHADGIIYNSQYLFNCGKKFFDIKEDNSLISPIGYNPNIFHQNINYDERGNIILYVGRMDAKKGIYRMFNIFEYIKDYLNENKYTILLIGRIEDDEFIEKLNRIEDVLSIKYIGEKSKQELVKLYNSALLTVVPSLYEALGLVAIESMACGTPVACYPVGGLNEIIVDQFNGLNLAINSDKKSSFILKDALARKGVLEKYSETAKEDVQKYNINNTHRDMLTFINKIILS